MRVSRRKGVAGLLILCIGGWVVFAVCRTPQSLLKRASIITDAHDWFPGHIHEYYLLAHHQVLFFRDPSDEGIHLTAFTRDLVTREETSRPTLGYLLGIDTNQ